MRLLLVNGAASARSVSLKVGDDEGRMLPLGGPSPYVNRVAPASVSLYDSGSADRELHTKESGFARFKTWRAKNDGVTAQPNGWYGPIDVTYRDKDCPNVGCHGRESSVLPSLQPLRFQFNCSNPVF